MVLRSTLPLERCKKCGTDIDLTRHHVFPKRFKETWTSRERAVIIVLCRPCHNLIELLIAGAECLVRRRLTPELYTKIASLFLRGELTAERVRLLWRLLRRKLDTIARRAIAVDMAIVRTFRKVVSWLEIEPPPMPLVY